MPDEFERQRIRDEFATRRMRQWALTILILPVLAIGLVRPGHSVALGIPVVAFMPLIVGVAIFATVFSLFNWRCPACNRYLGRTLAPRYCSRCGAELR